MGRRLAVEWIFPDEKPFHIVQARVSHGFHKAIEKEAEERGETTSELLRNLVGIHFVPKVLSEKIQQGKDLDSRDREAIETCFEYLSLLADSLKKVSKQYENLKIQRIRNEATQLLSEEGDARKRLIDEVAKGVAEMIFGKSRSKAGAQEKLKMLLEASGNKRRKLKNEI